MSVVATPNRLDSRKPRAEGVSARHHSPYRTAEQLARLIWAVVQASLFRYSPRPLWRWRNWLLRLFGARVSPSARLHPTVKISFPWNIEIGANTSVGDAAILYAVGELALGCRTTVSQYAHLCAGTHDYRTHDMPLIRSPIVVGDDVWIAADAFVGPGAAVGDGAIVGARAVVVKDVAAWTLVAGNPAEYVKAREPHAC